jgi:hypothetical protein
VKPDGPQLVLRVEPLEPRPAVSTFTDVKVRVTCVEPQASQAGRSPAPYAAMDIRTSNGPPQSSQV